MTTRDDKWTPTDLSVSPEEEALLEGLFSQARQDAAEAPPALMARIVADAEAEVAARSRQTTPARPKSRHPLVAAMVSAVGGWRSVGGMGFATVMGVALGFGLPVSVTSLSTGDTGGALIEDMGTVAQDDGAYTLDDLLPSFYDLGMEG